jgi:hypothetical protein
MAEPKFRSSWAYPWALLQRDGEIRFGCILEAVVGELPDVGDRKITGFMAITQDPATGEWSKEPSFFPDDSVVAEWRARPSPTAITKAKKELAQ